MALSCSAHLIDRTEFQKTGVAKRRGALFHQLQGRGRKRFDSRLNVHGWKDRWSNGGPAPQLFLRKHEDENVIYDSRSGQSVEYAIPDVTAKMLHSMEVKPKDLVDLSREFATVSEFDVTKEMAFLQEKGLVFEEKERYLSVALIAKNGAKRPRFKL